MSKKKKGKAKKADDNLRGIPFGDMPGDAVIAPCANCAKLTKELETRTFELHNARLAITEIYRKIGGTAFAYGASALKKRIEGVSDGTD